MVTYTPEITLLDPVQITMGYLVLCNNTKLNHLCNVKISFQTFSDSGFCSTVNYECTNYF